MGCVIKYRPHDPLTKRRLKTIIKALKGALKGRADSAYLFGSAARGDFSATSDVDLIIVRRTKIPFTKRFRGFLDLKDIFASMDILIYTPAEFESFLTRLNVGFWKKLSGEMQRIM